MTDLGRLGGMILCLAAASAAADEPQAAALRHFETRIRPVLVEHCYECHSAKAEAAGKLRGGLRLDTRGAARRGGDSGPAVVPGNVDESLLVSAIRRESFEMPPQSALPPQVIADFVQWIAAGAIDPRDETTAPALAEEPSQHTDHWAFRSIQRPVPPTPKAGGMSPPAMTEWIRTPIDAFILARLEAAGLAPSPEADKRTLIRRLTYDLIGLPPTPQEVDAFLADDRPGAYARLVDRLLASPHYGERWGRHWLDVARYADTKDLVLLYGKDRIRPYAYTYRDYVVRAFNDDLPYDDFVRHQLAADRMPAAEPWQLAALGFLTLGRLFDNNPPDIYDDQIDTVTRGLLGLTVACARCHDHKYDPIPQADYYSLYGVFANSLRPVEQPLTTALADTPGSEEFEKQAAPKREALRKFIDDHAQEVATTARNRIGDYLAHVATTKPDPVTENAVFFMSLSPDDLKPQFLSAWRRFLRNTGDEDPIFGPWNELMQRPAEGSSIIQRWQQRPMGVGHGQLNPLVAKMLAERAADFRTREDVARAYGDLLKTAFDLWTSRSASKESRLAEQVVHHKNQSGDELATAREQLAELLQGRSSPFFFPKSHTYLYLSRVPRSQYSGKLLELDKLAVHAPNTPPRAMVLVDSEVIHEPRLFIRGNPNQPGDIVPRQFLEVLSRGPRTPFTDGSGRLELAEAIVDPRNPLTARVFVNRVWQHHFGQPLVGTPSDFGLRSDPPTHPELLDWLAAEFIESGWSIKHLHRLIVSSAVYRQQSRESRVEGRGTEKTGTEGQTHKGIKPKSGPQPSVDPDNRLLWRMNRRRLGLEAMRDGMLAVSGRLDQRLYGRPTELVYDPLDRRRTIYGLVDRQGLPGLYRAFDFASPDQSAAMRPQTTTPQQALFGMNSEFVWQQANALAERVRNDESDDARIERLHRLVFQRPARPEDIAAARQFLTAVPHEKDAGDPWTVYAQVLLLTNEAMFVD